MKIITKTITVVALAAAGIMAVAQDAKRPGGPGGPGGPEGGPGRPRMVHPVVAALDANHDGVIDAAEMANAAAALRTLDKNGDGQLTKEEIQPARPEGGRGPGGPGGPGGPDGPRGEGRPPRPGPGQ